MCEFRENKGSKTFKIHSKGGDNFRFWQRPEKESQLSHLNCMRKSPVPCSFKNRKCLFPKRKLSAEEALPCTANSPLRTGLCIGAEARQKNALLADHAQKDCMFTRHFMSPLLEFEEGHLPAACAANAKWLPPAPAIPMLLWQPMLKLNSRGKTMEIKVILFLSFFLAAA